MYNPSTNRKSVEMAKKRRTKPRPEAVKADPPVRNAKDNLSSGDKAAVQALTPILTQLMADDPVRSNWGVKEWSAYLSEEVIGSRSAMLRSTIALQILGLARGLMFLNDVKTNSPVLYDLLVDGGIDASDPSFEAVLNNSQSTLNRRERGLLVALGSDNMPRYKQLGLGRPREKHIRFALEMI